MVPALPYFVTQRNRGWDIVEAAILPLCLGLESDKSVASTLLLVAETLKVNHEMHEGGLRCECVKLCWWI